MPEVENVGSLQTKLRALAKKGEGKPSVIVGYTAAYAIFVHENLQAHHTNGSAKFLEEPARRLQGELKAIVVDASKQGVPLGRALFMAGLRLQRESQQMCPVLTGNMRASAFTRLEAE